MWWAWPRSMLSMYFKFLNWMNDRAFFFSIQLQVLQLWLPILHQHHECMLVLFWHCYISILHFFWFVQMVFESMHEYYIDCIHKLILSVRQGRWLQYMWKFDSCIVWEQRCVSFCSLLNNANPWMAHALLAKVCWTTTEIFNLMQTSQMEQFAEQTMAANGVFLQINAEVFFFSNFISIVWLIPII